MKIDTTTVQGKRYQKFIYSLLMVSSFSLVVFWLYEVWKKIPSDINVKMGQQQGMEFMVPATARIYKNREEDRVDVDLSREVVFFAGEEDTYTMKVNLFGVIPFKESSVSVIKDKKLIPAGAPVGIFVETDGILVIDTGSFYDINGNKTNPAGGVLKPGDYIHKLNGEDIKNKQDLIDQIADCEGKEILLEITREEKKYTVNLTPRQNEIGEYKLGIWVRDNAQGIGTLTYIDEEGNFGALGHGINDIDTANLMELKEGGLYKTDIISITKGEDGSPGELTGIIAYAEKYKLGTIDINSVEGIYGTIDPTTVNSKELLSIALKQEVVKGPAQILTTISGERTYYDIEITDIHQENDNINRGLELKVTDPHLLDLTGGIVQGMSGSPILQDGKLVGAVTHVLVNDPTRGYGIFIENMLEATE